MKTQKIKFNQTQIGYKKSRVEATQIYCSSVGNFDISFNGIPGPKRVNKIFNFLSKIFGKIEEHESTDGFRFITSKNKRGIRLEETKIFPNGKKVTVAMFEKNGKTPTLRQTYIKNGRKWKMVKESAYLNGQHYFTIEFGENNKYLSAVANSNTQIEIEIGRINWRRKCKPESKCVCNTNYLNKFAEPKYKKADGVLYRVRMEDIEKLKGTLSHKSITNSILVLENPIFEDFKNNTDEMPIAWITQNLANVKNIPVCNVNGFMPKDVVNLFLLKSMRARHSYNRDFDEIGLSMLNRKANKNNKPIINNFWNVSERQRDENPFSIFATVDEVVDDKDFQIEAKYLAEYSINKQLQGAFNEFISTLRFKIVDLTGTKPSLKKGRKQVSPESL